MAGYVRMPKAHYEAACNSIRAKTGKTDLITSGAMSAEIDGITGGGGGGSVDGYATVTFMNGAEVLFSRLVLKGDDCPDPYVQNRIELPTKESTAQYTYTFNGWSATNGGSADSNALKGITEDKTLYAAFNANLVYFTVNFYDGDTLLKTEQVAYGNSSTYQHVKAGYEFKGWTPTPTNVTANMDCYGEWEESLEIADSWDEIIASVNDGTYATKYKIGQYKPLDLGSEGVVRMQFVYSAKQSAELPNKSDVVFDSDEKTSMSFVAMDLLATKKRFNDEKFNTNTFPYGWSICSLRSYLQNTIMALVPSNVASAIKTVSKYSQEQTGYTTKTANKYGESLWIPSYREMFSSGSYRESHGASYSRFFTSNELRARAVVGTSSNATWLMRTVSNTTDSVNGGYCLYAVSSTGAYSTAMVSINYGVCIGFCI